MLEDMKIVVFALQLSILAVIVAGARWWLAQTQDRQIISIHASHDIPAEQGIPVYAQFVATQTLRFDNPTTITRIELPIYRPVAHAVPLTIEVAQRGHLLQRWQYREVTGSSAYDVDLPLVPLTLQGEVDVIFSARNVSAEDAKVAPRIFAESAGHYYEEGSYRIADNEKTGDIAMVVTERVTNGNVLAAQWKTSPLLVFISVGRWVPAVLLALFLPVVLTPKSYRMA